MSHDRLQAMRQAREQQAQRENRRLASHARVIARLRAGQGVEEILAAANSQIALWQQGHLCSLDYILAWRDVIASGPRRVADVLEDRSAYGIRMRQNTPFAHHLAR
ncbi:MULTISPECIES: hypothetical protein [Burkholderia cepacia complex]|uniref:Uncharacterized protein n=1 Tax=Burkholderia contaminans TaxID=488447 RepID=A0A2S5DM95_9BURK|nr:MULTISPECIES: hypothetical protein [Burkholderia cepacia complex]KVR89488.1 hypothetical protein WK28_24060 [Burkholderia vietnamiensis]MBR7919701.1 hypothetical protein [Burkholderia vietnamiensis]MBR8205350.1 hypothetical protein [Burkholderia vietnamiensis]POZ80207.1 hypothetical protein C3743_40230 [Burkholderia contaminans]HDR9131998.1 hypothetical protein [Burkholderia vietnamiensis]